MKKAAMRKGRQVAIAGLVSAGTLLVERLTTRARQSGGHLSLEPIRKDDLVEAIRIVGSVGKSPKGFGPST